MHKIDSNTAKNGKFVSGNPSTGTKATQFTADWCNAVQDEIANVVTGSGASLNKNTNNQLYGAILDLLTPTVISDSLASKSMSTTTATLTSKDFTFGLKSVLDIDVCFNASVASDIDILVSVVYKNSSMSGEEYATKKISLKSGKGFYSVRFAIKSSATSGGQFTGYVQAAHVSGSTAVSFTDIAVNGVVHRH